MAERAPRARQVFINVPFDRDYEPCFLALIAGLVGVGFVPRSVLQVPPSEDRLRRIYGMVRACRYSVHDLSRVELSGGLPRLNMAFEAGLASALALMRVPREPHERFALEAQAYRLQRTCSDLNGTDPAIHGGTSEGMLHAVRNLFGRHEPTPIEHLRTIANALEKAARSIKTGGDPAGLWTGASFDKLVVLAQTLHAALRADPPLRPRARVERRRKP